MSDTCATPIPHASLVDYWAADLPPGEEERLEEHLMSCAACTAASERLAALATAVRALIPLVIDRAAVAALAARGVRVVENALVPEERRTAVFGRDTDILLHVLGGLDLSRAERVEVSIRDEASGQVIVELPQVPFDRGAGEVLVACQRHFATYPPNIVVEVTAHDREGGRARARFPIPHLFEERG